MKCPKCGFEDVGGSSCPRCGIVIAKYLEARAEAEAERKKLGIHYDLVKRKSHAGWYLLALLILGGAVALFWRAASKEERQPAKASYRPAELVKRPRIPSVRPSETQGMSNNLAPGVSQAPEISEPLQAEPRAAAPEPAAKAPAWKSSYISYSWHKNADGFRKALEEHKSYGAPMVIYFRTDWCGYCKRLDRNYLSDPDVDLFLGNLVKVKINPEDGPAENSLARSYGVTGYPTFLILGHGDRITRIHTSVKTPEGRWAAITTRDFIKQCQSAAR